MQSGDSYGAGIAVEMETSVSASEKTIAGRVRPIDGGVVYLFIYGRTQCMREHVVGTTTRRTDGVNTMST